jgi:hypothetical protein
LKVAARICDFNSTQPLRPVIGKTTPPRWIGASFVEKKQNRRLLGVEVGEFTATLDLRLEFAAEQSAA